MSSKKKAEEDAVKKRPMTPQMIVEALAVGIIRADVYHRNYTLPPHFEAVLNRFHFRLVEAVRFDLNGLAMLSFTDCWTLFNDLPVKDPEYVAWSVEEAPDQIEPPVAIAPKRTFIDLAAVVQNAVHHLTVKVKYGEFETARLTGGA